MMKANPSKRLLAGIAMAAAFHLVSPSVTCGFEDNDQVLEWNQIFIDTLVAMNTPNSSSQRLGAIFHTAIFDAYNGIERRYAPIYVHGKAPAGASRRAAVIAAAYTALVGIFPSLSSSQRAVLDASYTASLIALSDDGGDGGQSRKRGIAWGTEVALAVLAWRATDGFNEAHTAFAGGTETGQWRPTGGSCVTMTGLGLAYTEPFVVANTTQFDPGSPRGLANPTYVDDFNSIKAFGRKTASRRTDDQTALAPFWEGNASVHWNQAANQIARTHHLSLSESNRLLAVLNIAMADTAFTVWTAKRFYGGDAREVTWRPLTAILLADTDPSPSTEPDPDWVPLVATPCHPEYPAGHPSLNGAAATVLLSRFDDAQTFTLTTRLSGVDLPDRTYTKISRARADGNNARVWGGMHYPSTVAISDQVGAAVANYVNSHAMQLVH
jgi:hypothetical protein